MYLLFHISDQRKSLIYITHVNLIPLIPGLQLNVNMQPGKVVYIKHAQHFDLRLKSLIMIDHNSRSLYRHHNSRSIVGFNLNV